MKYFTKDLILKSRSSNSRVAENAHKQWDKNMKNYWNNVERISLELPTKKAADFFKNTSLHDSTVVSFEVNEYLKSDFKRRSSCILKVQHPETYHYYTLKYSDIRKCLFNSSWKDSISDYSGISILEDWAYDELTLTHDKWFSHEILFSNDASLLIQFKRFTYSKGQ